MIKQITSGSKHTHRKSLSFAECESLANNRIKFWLVIALVAVLTGPLTGCATYVESDYGGYDNYDGWYPDADIDVFGGYHEGGRDAYAYSQRGYGSRGGGHWGGGGHFGGGGHGGGGHGR